MLKIFENFLETIYPKNYTCDICGKEIFDGGSLCKTCTNTLTFNNKHTCTVCGRHTDADEICIECKALAPKYKMAVSPLVYEGGAITLIHKFKKSDAYLKEYFADIIAPKCAKFDDAEALCSIPLTKRSLANRGYNQAELLAQSLGKRLNLPIIYNALIKKKQTEEQKTLNRAEREQNLAGCFKADKNLVKGKTLILVDDVMTTGATADEACTALLKAGAAKVYFATIASVTYKGEM
jgi:ComF family protein